MRWCSLKVYIALRHDLIPDVKVDIEAEDTAITGVFTSRLYAAMANLLWKVHQGQEIVAWGLDNGDTVEEAREYRVYTEDRLRFECKEVELNRYQG